MRRHTYLPILLFFFLYSASAGFVSSKNHGSSERKLFVFGDSYVDTGNWDPSIASSWKPPYGITYPGKPAGRFSDGHILTDYVASFFNIGSPVPYERRSGASAKELRFGMNFAYGGTGVFDTDISQPNTTLQINLFKDVLTTGKVFTSTDLHSSIALVSVGGNDYANFLKHGPELSLTEFTKFVINQLVSDLKLIHSLGVPKIAVTTMEPLGCMPSVTLFFGYKKCSKSLNDVAAYHNSLLQKSLVRLNNEARKPVFSLLDINGAFLSALQIHLIQPVSRNLRYENPLRPCCQGITSYYVCGSKEGNETKYTLCDNVQLAFFWDMVHPAQNGWHQVYQAIRPTLGSIV